MLSNPVGPAEAGDVEVATDGIVQLAETAHHALFTVSVFFAKLFDILNIPVTAICVLMEYLGGLWTDYYPRVVVFGEEAEMMPRSTLGFIITILIAFAEVKSQWETGFPFKTHPQAIMVSITSLLTYGLASAAQHVFSTAETGRRGIRNTLTTTSSCASDCLQPLTKFFPFY